MQRAVRYSFRDVLWAPGMALSAKQVLVMTVFLLAALAVYDLFTYIAFAINGDDLSFVFSVFSFFPWQYFHFGSLFAKLVYHAGIVASVLVLMLGFFGVSLITIERVRGNRFLSTRQTLRYTLRRFKQIFLSELSIVLFIGVIVLLFFLLGLASRIPWIGEWLYVLLFTIPNFIISLLSVFIIFVLTLSVLLLPAAAAAERRGEAFGSILETFSTIIRQPFRWFGYTIYSGVTAKLAGFVFAYFSFRAIQFLLWATSLGGGDRLGTLFRAGASHLPMRSGLVQYITTVFPGVPVSFSIAPWLRGAGNEPVTYVMSLMIFLIFASVLGYMLAVVAAGQAAGYVALRYFKDGYKIGDEESLFASDPQPSPPEETVE